MWTAARLVAAILFAAVGWYASNAVTLDLEDVFFPAAQSHLTFKIVITLIGVWQGWSVMGTLVGRGWGASIGNGLRTAVQVAVLGLIFFALAEMFSRSANLAYSDFGVAVIDALNLFIEYGAALFQAPNGVLILVAGGMVSGLLSEIASRLWR